MIELANTSLPNGLLPGTHGFATAGMTRGTPDAVRTLLEGLSSYVHRASGHDERYRTENPVAWHHVAPPRGGHVLSRVAACEFDYTGRTNRLARHWQADGAEWPAGCNAARALLANRSWFEAPWEGEARWFDAADAGRLAAGCGGAGSGPSHWVGSYGTKGAEWAAGLSRELRRQVAAGTAGRPLVVVTQPTWDPDGTKLLGLFADLIDGLPERERGRATFSTYAAVLPGWVPCALRGYMADDPALGALTAGRPWFDATAGVLHGAELLPAEGSAAAMEVRSGAGADAGRLRMAGPTGTRATTETVGTAETGMRRKKAGTGTGTKAFFAVAGVALVAVLGFFGWMLAGGTPPAEPKTDVDVDEPQTESVVEAEADEPETESAAPVVEIAPEPEPTGEDKEAPVAEVKTEAIPPPAPRLVEGGVWGGGKETNKPKAGDPGVKVMYYRDDTREWSEATPGFTEFNGVKRWKKLDEYWRVRLWIDARHQVYWEFAEPEVNADMTEPMDWRLLWLGPDERVWHEWEEETRGMNVVVAYSAIVVFEGTNMVTTNSASLSVADDLWKSAAENQLKRQVNDSKTKLARLPAEITALKEKRNEIVRKIGEMRQQVGQDESKRADLQRILQGITSDIADRENRGNTQNADYKKKVQERNAYQRQLAELDNNRQNLEKAESAKINLEKLISAKGEELEKLRDWQPPSLEAIETTMRKEAKMSVTLKVTVEPGE